MKKSAYFLILVALTHILSCSHKSPGDSIGASIDFQKAESLIDINRDSAFLYFSKIAINSLDTLETAMAYSYMAIIQSDGGDYFGSEENSLESIKHLSEKVGEHRGTLLSDYNELGSSSLKLKNYDDAVVYFDKALKFNDDKIFRNTILNNKALALQGLGKYDKALAIYQTAMREQKTNTLEYARILCNFSTLKWQMNAKYNPLPDQWIALSIRREQQNKRGINSSFSHLADYYLSSNPDSGLYYARKMYIIAQDLKNPDNILESLQKLILLAPRQESKKYFSRYVSLRDSLQSSRNNAKNQFALIKYEAAKMKTDKLALEKDNSDKETQIVALLLLLTLIIGLSVIGFLYYRKRKQKLFHDQQLKTSQKVHDTVANNIYRIMSELEHKDSIEKEELLEELDTVYEHSRNISYEIADPTSIHFEETLQDILTSFSSSKTAVLIVGNSNDIWKDTTSLLQNELQNILQELMVNMKKHSSARNVIIKFDREINEIRISYSDDGIGLPPDIKYGKGLRNTENRIKNIGGKIIFASSIEKGLKISLFIPIDVA